MRILIKGENLSYGELHPDLPKKQDTEYAFEFESLELEFDDSKRKLNVKTIELRKKCALIDIEKNLSEGEMIIDHRFGVLNKEHNDLKVNTPVLDVKTNEREFFIIFDELLLNQEGFLIQSGSGDLENTVDPVLKNPVLMFFVEQFASVLAKEVAGKIFEIYFPPSSDELIRAEISKIKDEVRLIMKESKYDRLEETLLINRGWLRDTYSNQLKVISESGITSVSWEALIKSLEENQQSLKGVVDIVDVKISANDLKSCDYLTRTKVSLYAACACLRIAMFREEISIRNMAIKANLVSYTTKAEEAELELFIKTVNEKIKHFKDALEKGRNDKLRWSGYTRNKVPYYGNAGEIRGFADIRKVSWNDNFSSKHKNDPFYQKASQIRL